MIDIYLCLLFILSSVFIYNWLGREHLEIEIPIEQRVSTLEDEYKQLHNIVQTQETRMSAASATATNLRANMQSIKT
jgi:hypothetical protein